MQSKHTDLISIKTSIFDVDDLSFLRTYGLGLRHVGLKKAKDELVNGVARGDAVSLACYGIKPKHLNSDHTALDKSTCIQFQEKVELFLLYSFKHFHESSANYNDAAFLLINYGDAARSPYDFNSYPLGKCGSIGFRPHQIMSSTTTDSFSNDDINHAVYNTLMDLKIKCRQIKLAKINELLQQSILVQDKELQQIIEMLKTYYQRNIFLDKPYFLIITNLLKDSMIRMSNTETIGLMENETIALDKVNHNIQQTELSNIKGDTSVKVHYQPIDIDLLDPQAVSKDLLVYIQNQNIQKVQQCMKHLSKTGFNPEKDKTLKNPLLVAAGGDSVEIVQALYEFEPKLYDDIIADKELNTPIFWAAKLNSLNHLKYWLNVRGIVAKDVVGSCWMTDKPQHILSNPVMNGRNNSVEIIQLLLNHGVTYGKNSKNESYIGDLFDPLAITAQCLSTPKCNEEIFNLLLPLADAWTKYLAILGATHEKIQIDGSPNKYKSFSDLEVIDSVSNYRNRILESLTSDECSAIHEIVFKKRPIINTRIKNMNDRLIQDLLHYALTISDNEKVKSNIFRCFKMEEKTELPSVSNVNGTMFHLPVSQEQENAQESLQYCINKS